MILWSNAEYCADRLGMSPDTLSLRIKDRYGCSFPEYKNKKLETVKINLRKKQYDTAMKGSVTMMIWLGKNLLNQSDQPKAQVGGNHIFNIEVAEWTEEEDGKKEGIDAN